MSYIAIPLKLNLNVCHVLRYTHIKCYLIHSIKYRIVTFTVLRWLPWNKAPKSAMRLVYSTAATAGFLMNYGLCNDQKHLDVNNCWWMKSGKLTSWGEGSLSPLLQGFSTIKGGCLGFLPSTVAWITFNLHMILATQFPNLNWPEINHWPNFAKKNSPTWICLN